MTRAPRWLRWATAAVLLATAFAVFAYGQSQERRAAVGRAAPAWTLPALAGGTVDLAAFRGRPVLLNFFASWCDVCAVEAPALETFARRYEDRVPVLGVDWREPWSAVRPFVARFGLTYPVLRDADGSIARAYGLTGVPETWLIDANGVARAHVVGGLTFEDMQALYRRATGRDIDAEGVPPVSAASGDRALALARSGQRLWIGTTRGLYESDNGGRTWTPVEGVSGPVERLVAGPDGAPVALLASGRLWVWPPGDKPVASGLGADVAAAALWTDTGSLAAWTPGGLQVAALDRAADAGAWQRIAPNDALPSPPWAIAFAPDGCGLAATAKGVYRSDDAGRTWRPTGLSEEKIDLNALSSPMDALRQREPLQATDLAYDAATGAVYLATAGGVWETSDFARTARPVEGAPARRLVAVAAGEGGVWALAPNGDVYVRTLEGTGGPGAPLQTVDAGGGWRRLVSGR
ncbi:MAG: redoxin domain-containing protein [Clostridia bacterium]|nr:redoxin domain-containing protein [Clostridia bacterium]